MERVIQLNNQGVSLLEARRDKQAVSSLSQALLMVQTAFAQEDQSSASSSSCMDVDPQHEIFHSFAASRKPLWNIQNSNYFVFNKAITIVPTSVPKSMEDASFYCAAVILNLALAYHRHFIRGNMHCIDKAEKLYGMVCTLLRDSPEDYASLMLFRMIATNNMSHLHYEQRRYEETRDDLSALSFLVRRMDTKIACVLDEADVNQLLLNVLLMTPPSHAPAA